MSVRARIEHALNQRWYGGRKPELLLLAMSAVYARLRPRNLAQKPNSTLPARVIVVGNLTAGGVGKTPLVMALAAMAQALGIRVGVISRGYGGSARGVVEVTDNADWREVGDEPLLIHQRVGVPVFVGADRLAAARALLARYPVQLLLADDGLQHHRLPRDAEIVVIDGERGFGNGQLLPAGPLREPIERLSSCDLVVARGGEAALKFDLAQGEPWQLRDHTPRPWATLKTLHHLVAFSGIGHPPRFFAGLREQGLVFEAKSLADHGALDAATLAKLRNCTLLTTEKDALKYAANAHPDIVVVPATVNLSPALHSALYELLRPCLSASSSLPG